MVFLKLCMHVGLSLVCLHMHVLLILYFSCVFAYNKENCHGTELKLN